MSIFTWDPKWRATANHHPLNTALMYVCWMLFGHSELALRLPNLVAHGVYVLCALALVRRVQNLSVRMAGFAFFNLNVFVAEYFFAARGYGLALAFEMLSLALLVRAYEEQLHGRRVRDVSLSVASGSLAVLSNFAFLNYYVPLLVVGLWLLLTDASLRRVSLRHVRAALVLASAGGVFVAGIFWKLFRLQRAGELLLGGHDSFVGDTVQSVVRCSLATTMESPALVKGISTVLIGLFVLLFLLGVRQLFSARGEAMFGVLVVLLALAAALPSLEHHLVGAPFPVGRAGRYYVPLYAVALLYALRALTGGANARWKRLGMGLLCLAMTVTLG